MVSLDRKVYDPGPGDVRVPWNPRPLGPCKRPGCPFHTACRCGQCFVHCRCHA